MLIKDKALFRVLLPSRMFEEARDKEDFKRMLAEYMRRYPNYIVKAIKDGFAVCERRE